MKNRITFFVLCFLGSASVVSGETKDLRPLQVQDPSHIIAFVNDQPLTVGQIDAWSSLIAPPTQNIQSEQRRIQTLRLMIRMRAFVNAAHAEKFDESQEFKKRMQLIYDSALQHLYVDKKIKTPISNTELKVRYKHYIAALPDEQEIHARHILLKTEKDADSVIKRLSEGESFEILAKENSTDGSAAGGGDLGYFTKGQMVKPFEDAAFALKVGEYTRSPVKTPFGWHIIKIEDRRTKRRPSLDESKSYLQNLILHERYQDLQKHLLTHLKVSYPDPSIGKEMGVLVNEEMIDQE
ncbi:MAG: peptidyl-prolyl cis-trans isomerase C [Candidatus Tokpelaia sp. JSC161]|jgi:hypothetical protein|nr:MAG: peptidyl-prolyl cis-trans isomerase C [Candidatus Tokpelaia sp. JSC161]